MKGLIFDFNGTVVWDVKYQEMAWKSYFKGVTGKQITTEELEEKFYGVPMRISLKKELFPESGIEEVMKHAEEKESVYRNAILENPEDFVLAPGLEELLDELKSIGVPMTIATASIEPNIGFFIEQLDLKRWFDPERIVYDNNTYEDKQDMFIEAARLIGRDISDCIIFEDSTSGIRDAREAGCEYLIAVNLGKDQEKYRNVECTQLISDYWDFDREIL